MPGYTEFSALNIAVARQVVEELAGGACLQPGIGAMPAAVGGMIAESDLKDLSVHTV